MNHILDKLKKSIEKTDKDKSSHWKYYLDKKDYKDIFLNMGFGNFTHKTNFSSPFHNFFLKLIFDKGIFRTEEFKKYKIIFDKMKRQIDVDTIRHIFTFNILKKYINPKKIGIIGDGKANGLMGALNLFPNSKIFSLNLSETLINDYIIMKNFNIVREDEIQVIENIEDKIDHTKRLFLIPSSFKEILKDNDIDLFINIASFQEMDKVEINNYMNLIKNNRSLLYSCNREYKKLLGGEELIFSEYPWGNGTKIFYEDCPWHQKFYSFKPPFIHKYDGNIQHCLIDYSNS